MVHVTLVEAQGGPAVLDVRCLSSIPLWQVFVAWAVNRAFEFKISVGVDHTE